MLNAQFWLPLLDDYFRLNKDTRLYYNSTTVSLQSCQWGPPFPARGPYWLKFECLKVALMGCDQLGVKYVFTRFWNIYCVKVAKNAE